METHREFYVKYWPQLFSFKKKYPDLSNPLLIGISEEYKKQGVKLFVVGQQTKTWYDDCKMSSDIGSVDKLISIYKDKFNLGMCCKITIFWQAVRKLESGLCILDQAFFISWEHLSGTWKILP